MVETNRTGVFNATGPDYTLTMGQLLDESKSVSGRDTQFTWVNEEFLAEEEVELPIWVPDTDIGAATIDCGKAIAAGLTFRPLADTIRGTLAWDAAHPPELERRAGLKPEQEVLLLQAWHDQKRE